METLNEIKILWKYLRKYKKKIWPLIILGMTASSIAAFLPYFYGRLIDLVSIKSTDFTFIFALLGMWFLMSLASVFMTRTVDKQGAFLSIDCLSDLICETSAHVINLPLKFHKEKKTGEIFSKIDRAGDYLGRIIEDVVFWLLPQLFSVMVSILIMFFVEWRLAAGVLMIVLGYFFIIILKTKPIIKVREKLNKTVEEVYGNLYDSFSNILLIKSGAAEDFQREKTRKDFKEKFSVVSKDFEGLWKNLNLWQDIIFSLGFVLIFSLAILFTSRGLISIGKLVMFLGYLGLIQAPLKNLGRFWQVFRAGMTSIRRVQDLLGVEGENFNRQGITLKDLKGKIEFKNISFGYKDHVLVLNNINFIARPGEKIALVGGSGEGKTTLVDLVSLYFKPSKGKIFLDDVDIQNLDLHFLRKIIAYVPQEITLFDDTIKNNLLYGNPEATDEQIIIATKAANAHNFIESFPQKYDTVVGERGIKLSTGQKQRLAIALALVENPKILILDEATSSLDSESEKLVQEALERLVINRTTFIVAHRLSTIRKADKILVLEKGKIVEIGNHEELIKKKGAYHKFYSLQFKDSD